MRRSRRASSWSRKSTDMRNGKNEATTLLSVPDIGRDMQYLLAVCHRETMITITCKSLGWSAGPVVRPLRAWHIRYPYIRRRHASSTFNFLNDVTIWDNTGQDVLEATVKKRRLRWFGHVQRMEDSGKAKQALYWIPDEKRNHASPGETQSGEM